MYASMMLNRLGYKAMMKKSFEAKQSGGLMDRTVRQQAATYVSASTAFFVNEHHRLCLQAVARDVYNYFFTRSVPNPLNKATTSYRASDPWGQKFQQFFQLLPKSYELLSGIYLVEREWGVSGPAVWRVSAPGVGVAAPAVMPGAESILQPLV